MKKVALSLVACAVATSSVFAGDIEIAPYVGGHFFNKNRDLKNTGEVGLSLEKALTDNGIAVLGSLGYVKTDKKSDNDDQSLGTYGLNLIKNYDIGK